MLRLALSETGELAVPKALGLGLWSSVTMIIKDSLRGLGLTPWNGVKVPSQDRRFPAQHEPEVGDTRSLSSVLKRHTSRSLYNSFIF